MTIRVGLVLVSHSEKLAKGLAEVAGQMAPDVEILPAGGTDDDRIGTSFDLIEQAIHTVLKGGATALVLTDLGSATMTAEAVVEMVEGQVALANAPFVEGTVAAAIAAQRGGDLKAVHAAAVGAIDSFTQSQSAPSVDESGVSANDDVQPSGLIPLANNEVSDVESLSRTMTLQNKLGLHARPAAAVARIAGQHDATVTINGIDAASVLALMGLALPGGAEVTITATGPHAQQAMEALVPEFEAGFGEE